MHLHYNTYHPSADTHLQCPAILVYVVCMVVKYDGSMDLPHEVRFWTPITSWDLCTWCTIEWIIRMYPRKVVDPFPKAEQSGL